jgi:hypothetical protein
MSVPGGQILEKDIRYAGDFGGQPAFFIMHMIHRNLKSAVQNTILSHIAMQAGSTGLPLPLAVTPP